MTWSSRGSSEKWGILLAHSTSVKSCLSAAWQMLVTGSLGWRKQWSHKSSSTPRLDNVHVQPQRGATIKTTHRAASWASICMQLRLLLYSHLRLQNLLYRHLLVHHTGRLHLTFSLLVSLPLLLDSCRNKGDDFWQFLQSNLAYNEFIIMWSEIGPDRNWKTEIRCLYSLMLQHDHVHCLKSPWSISFGFKLHKIIYSIIH